MTVADLFRDGEGRWAYFECAGHASEEAEGDDIICAAISMLVINTINSLETLAGADITYANDEQGWGNISCRFETPPDEKASLLVDSMLLGLQTVRDTYGEEHLVINLKEE